VQQAAGTAIEAGLAWRNAVIQHAVDDAAARD